MISDYILFRRNENKWVKGKTKYLYIVSLITFVILVHIANGSAFYMKGKGKVDNIWERYTNSNGYAYYFSINGLVALGIYSIVETTWEAQELTEQEITTIENYEKRIPIARENFRRAGKADRITLIEGDAAEVLTELTGEYDFIFMDAAKGQYIHYFPEVMRLLAKGGCLVSDNVMQDGDIIESRFAVERRNRTIHARMREYLYELKHNEELITSIIPLGDGVTVSIKK